MSLEMTVRASSAELGHAARAWLQPVSQALPAGEDARHHADHETVRSEIAKLEAPTGSAPDWAKVVERASAILEAQAKDLLMACCLCLGQYHREGWSGLAVGLAVVDGILVEYAASAFPTRPRARANAIGFLASALDNAIASRPPDGHDVEGIANCEQLVRRVGASAETNLARDIPGFGPLLARLERQRAAARPAAAPPTPPPLVQPPRATGPLPTAMEPSDIEELADSLLACGKVLVTAGNLARRASLRDPAGYRLVRQGVWLHLATAPVAGQNGRTSVPALPRSRRDPLMRMYDHQKWPELIEEAESTLSQFRFCLDLQRLTHHALGQLGPDHAAARASVVAELLAALDRMPELPERHAADGTPFADPQTAAWLQGLRPGAPVTPVQATAPAGANADAWEAVASALTHTGLTEAMASAVKVIAAAPDDRARFELRLGLAELCARHGQLVLARGMFAALEARLRELGLELWDTALARRCLEGLISSDRTPASSPSSTRTRAFERLCLVDPVAAAGLVGP